MTDGSAGPLKAIIPATLMIFPSPRSCMRLAMMARVSRVGASTLTRHQLTGLVGGQFGQGHVVGDAGVVDQHGQRLGGGVMAATVSMPASVERLGGDDPDRDVRVGGRELLEAFLAAADDDQVVAVGGEAVGEGPADAGGGAGDEGELVHWGPFLSGAGWSARGDTASAHAPMVGGKRLLSQQTRCPGNAGTRTGHLSLATIGGMATTGNGHGPAPLA